MTGQHHTLIDQSFIARQKDVLFNQSLSVITFNLLLGFILVAILWAEVPHDILLGWLVIVAIVVAGRVILVLVHDRNILRRLHSNQWIDLYGFGAFLTGCIWGACVPLFGSYESLLTMNITALWPGGISAGALASYALVKRVFFALSIPALFPGIIYISWYGPSEVSLLGLGLAVYLVFLGIIASYSHKTQRKAFDLEWENTQLAYDLKLKNEAIMKLNRDLESRLYANAAALQEEAKQRESNEQRLRYLIEHSPSAIAMLDRNLHYLTASERWLKDYRIESKPITGVSHYEIFPDIPDRWRAINERCLAGISERASEDQFERADGSVDWINWEVSPWYDDTGQIGGIVIYTEVITEKKKAEEEILRLMTTDSLTNLPNQYSFQQELDRFCARDDISSFCLTLFEIRRFSDINSALGYEGADSLLRKIADRSQAQVGSKGYVARLGASIFAIIWPMISDPSQALARFLNLKSQLTETIDIEGATFEPQIIAGIVLYPLHGESSSILLRNATAARRAARLRREGIAVYEQEQAVSASSLGELADLRKALSERQLELVFQPKLDLRMNCICGAEALIRWRHPVRGYVPPNQFIPLAEESGFITSLTEWVIESAIRECAIWHENGFLIGVSVNVSARDILEPRFIHALRSFAKEKLVPVESVTLEITESAVMDEPVRTFEAISNIRAAGWRIALDDYGTGYSSLSYLTRLPVHELKIDQSFIMNMKQGTTTERIIRSTISLGHDLDLNVTAEGIESEEIKECLVQMGCDTGQGYGISRPLAKEAFLEFCRGYKDHASVNGEYHEN